MSEKSLSHRFIINALMAVLMIAALSACETLDPPRPGKDIAYAPTYPVTPDPKRERHVNGSIYNAETVIPLFETPRARHAGDLLTVVLLEKTNAQKQATTRQRKNDTIEIENNTFAGRPIALGSGYNLDFDLQSRRQFDGDAQSIQNNQLNGKLSVTVAKVLANGNMVIQGEKWMRLNQGNEFVQISGIVRPQDIRPDNTITSDRIANARFSYGGTGQVNNTNAQGWVSRFLWGSLFLV